MSIYLSCNLNLKHSKMKKQSKYAIGNVFYLQAIKEDVMVVAPTEAGTVAYVVPAKDPNLVLKYNIRTNKFIK